MKLVVAAIIERDRKLLICQRRADDASPLKWEFPGGKVEPSETPEAALARELREELDVTLRKCREVARVQHKYPHHTEPLEIRFFVVEIKEGDPAPRVFEQIAWVLPRELGEYDFLAANTPVVARLATGKIKPAELLEAENPAS
jgi:8-oxo-dGTP diphosphatase